MLKALLVLVPISLSSVFALGDRRIDFEAESHPLTTIEAIPIDETTPYKNLLVFCDFFADLERDRRTLSGGKHPDRQLGALKYEGPHVSEIRRPAIQKTELYHGMFGRGLPQSYSVGIRFAWCV